MEGWVYVITHKGHPGLVKIGYTDKAPDVRAREMNSTGSPYPHLVEYAALVENPVDIEDRTHKYLDHLRERHKNSAGVVHTGTGREWFRCSIEEAISTIKLIAGSTFISETYNGADREAARKKVEELHRQKEIEAAKNREIAEAKKKIADATAAAEKKIDDATAAIIVKYDKIITSDFSPKPDWVYWVVAGAITFFAVLIFRPKAADGFGFLLFCLGGGWLGGSWLSSIAAERKKNSKSYREIIKKRDYEIAQLKLPVGVAQAKAAPAQNKSSHGLAALPIQRVAAPLPASPSKTANWNWLWAAAAIVLLVVFVNIVKEGARQPAQQATQTSTGQDTSRGQLRTIPTEVSSDQKGQIEAKEESDRIKWLFDAKNYEGVVQEAYSGKKILYSDYGKIGAALYATGRYREALNAFLDAEKQFPNDSVIKSNLGDSYYAVGDTSNAMKKFREALALDHNNSDAQQHIAMLEGMGKQVSLDKKREEAQAAEKRREVRSEQERVQVHTEVRVAENRKLDALINSLQTKYPELNKNSTQYNQKVVDYTNSKQRAYIQQGHSPSNALQMAVEDIAKEAAAKRAASSQNNLSANDDSKALPKNIENQEKKTSENEKPISEEQRLKNESDWLDREKENYKRGAF